MTEVTKKPLHNMVRPRGNRDDAGVRGEQLHQLADTIETHCATVEVTADASMEAVVEAVNVCLGKIPPSLADTHKQAVALLLG